MFGKNSTISQIKIRLTFVLLGSFVALQAVQAVDYSSGSFTVQNPTFGIGGTHEATSANFSMTGIAGQSAPGASESENFNGEMGFEYFSIGRQKV